MAGAVAFYRFRFRVCYLLPVTFTQKKVLLFPLLSFIYINIFIIFINNIKVTKVTEYSRALFFKGSAVLPKPVTFVYLYG